MNGHLVHLVLNHVPVLGTVFVVIALAAGVLLKNRVLERFAFVVLVGVALSAVPAYFTGEPAEESLEHAAGISKTAIESHESVAQAGLIVLGVLGLLAILALIRTRGGRDAHALATALLVLTLVAGGLMAWTAHLGGMIHRPELRAGTPAPAGAEAAGVETRGTEAGENEGAGHEGGADRD